jgi:SAM-dependent methyltransferase
MNNHNKLIASQYNIISKVFDNSRVRIWNNVKQFLLESNTANTANTANTLLDCGCGNGKNMIYAQSLGYHSEGFDISNNLLDICKNKGLKVYYQDVLNFKANKKYNKIISIAVLHHLQTFEEQIAAIKILCDCLDNNGKLLVSFWSKEKTFEDIKEYCHNPELAVPNVRNKSDSRDFVTGPNYVTWKLDRENIIQRFYYIHDYKSIQELAKNINVKYTISWEQQNWFIIFSK